MILLEDTVADEARGASRAQLMRSVLRLWLGRIVVGEVRGTEEALDLLGTWSAGHESGSYLLAPD